MRGTGDETEIHHPAADACRAAVAIWQKVHLHGVSKTRRQGEMRLRADAIFLCGREKPEQTRDGGVTAIGGHKELCLELIVCRREFPPFGDERRGNGIAFPHVGAGFARSGRRMASRTLRGMAISPRAEFGKRKRKRLPAGL